MIDKYLERLNRLYSIFFNFFFLVFESIAKKNLSFLYQSLIGIRGVQKYTNHCDITNNNLEFDYTKRMETSFLEYEKGNYNLATNLWVEAASAKKEGLESIGFDEPNLKILGAAFNQIGHLAGGLGTRAMLKKLDLTEENYIYLCDGQTNSFYANLFGSYFPVVNLQPYELIAINRHLWQINEDVFTVETKKGTLDFLTAHNYALEQFTSRNRLSPLLELPEKQIDLGWDYLRRFGIKERSWFVTLHVRENKNDPNSKFYARNANPFTYLPMIDLIRSLGGFVIRIGSKSLTTLPKIPGLVDLTGERKLPEFLDIFALSQCRFMVGTNSGPSAVPSTFGVPVLITNAVAFGKIAFFPNSLSIPKLVETSSGALLPFSQVLDSPLAGLDSYLHNWEGFEAGMSWRNNTPDEILNGTIEMLSSEVFNLTSEQQKIINKVVPNFTNGTVPVSKYFISKHSKLFEGIID
jgi:putative glycosyltransferase (TIGR04372 family)